LKFDLREQLLQSEQAHYKILVGFMYCTINAEFAFTAIRLFSKDVAFERLLVCDLSGSSYLKSFFGAGVRFNLWHYYTFCGDTLLALPN
jgi:hypothetical protein